MSNYFENEYAEYLLIDQIVHITYKKGVNIDLAASVEIVKDRLMFQQGKSFPILCDIRNLREVNKSARDYLAIEGSLWVKAVAFIIEPPVSEVLSKFYLKTSNPPIPIESFKQIPEALSYLNTFLKLIICFSMVSFY